VKRGVALPQPKVRIEDSGSEIERPDVVVARMTTAHESERHVAEYVTAPSAWLSNLGIPFALA
jgi:hypothetical protein